MTPKLRRQWEKSRKHIAINRTYRHYKGGVYRVLALAHDCETLEPIVVYENVDDGGTFTRKASNWLSPSKDPDTGVKNVRFVLLGIQ